MSQSYASAGLPLDPVFTDWTPTLGNMTQGNGVIVARYTPAVPGGLVVATFKFTLGSTSTVGSTPTISVPQTPLTGNIVRVGGVWILESGALIFDGAVELSGTTDFIPKVSDPSSTHVTFINITSAIPMTWGTDDILSFSAQYEAA